MKLYTEVDPGRSRFGVSYADRILVLGSCFADQIGGKLADAGFQVCVNPFGTLYNPVSVQNALARLSSGIPFSEVECRTMGAGMPLVCSFSHHTAFARETPEAFLTHANEELAKASDFYKNCNRVIITLGTAWCYRFNETGETVSNCLKRPAREFTRYRLEAGMVETLLERMLAGVADKDADKARKVLFTVSPIRHLGDTAHGNQLSKATLLLALEKVCARRADVAEYFPAYEIQLDQLRDYRFYADDLVHPSSAAVDIIWEKFQDFALPPGEKEKLLVAEKLHRSSMHRKMHG